MNRRSLGSLNKQGIGAALSATGEWVAYPAAAWLAYSTGGVGMAAAYLILTATPSAVLRTRWLPGALAAPAAFAILAWFDSAGAVAPLHVGIAGMLAGLGASFARRTPAWVAGLSGPIETPAAIGAAGAVLLTFTGNVVWALGVASVLMLAGLLLAEQHDQPGFLPSPLFPASLAAGVLVGMRVLESAHGSSELPTPAVFALAWALGGRAGWKYAGRADARLVLAAPFLAASALVASVAMEGPGLLAAHAAVAASVALVAGQGNHSPSNEPDPRRGWMLVAAALGAVWSFLAVDPESRLELAGGFDAALMGAAAVCIFGGFVSLALARRIPAPDSSAVEVTPSLLPVTQPEPLITAVPSALSAADLAIEAAVVLRGALAEARAIRRAALEAVRLSGPRRMDPVREELAGVIDELAGAAGRVGRAVASATAD